MLTNGRIRVAPGAPPVSSLTIHDGAVVSVDGNGGVAEVPREARVIDLAGRTVLPAFTDSHTHFNRGSILRHLYLDFEALGAATVGDVLGHVRGRAAVATRGSWVQGDSLSTMRLAEARLPTRHELDEVAPDHLVLLRGIGKHVVAANSAALVAAGISRDTDDPPGGRIERDETGEPTGVLHERAKLRLDASHPETVVPMPSTDERRAALQAGFRELHRRGVTTIHEMVRQPEEAGDLSLLHATGELGVRVRLYYRVHETPLSLDALIGFGVRRGFGDDWLRIAGIKISVDGFCIFRNAAVYRSYSDAPEDCGLIRIEPARLNELVTHANAQGLNISVHAVGVRAVDVALAAFEAAGDPLAGPHRVEHGYLDVGTPTLERMHRLGLALSTQPGFFASYSREWHEIFGDERVRTMMPLGSAVALGIPILLNSDYPCAPIDPLAAVRIAVERTIDGRDVGRHEAISRVDAWRAVTVTPSEVVNDRRSGRLDVGSPADLVVFDDDPLEESTDLAALSVAATMLDGRFVYERPGGAGWTDA